MNEFIKPIEIWIAVALAALIVFGGALGVLLLKKDRQGFSVFADTPSEGSLDLHPIVKQKPDRGLIVLLAWVFAAISILSLVYQLIAKK
jgi:hypothetical protein